MAIALIILAVTLTVVIFAAVKVAKRADEWEEEYWKQQNRNGGE